MGRTRPPQARTRHVDANPCAAVTADAAWQTCEPNDTAGMPHPGSVNVAPSAVCWSRSLPAREPGEDMSTLMPILVLLLLAWIWLDGARAREIATALARRHCDRHDLQFLDETVALARMGLRWTQQGIRIRRMFRFDFSLEGVGRRTGYILLLGLQLETIDDGLPSEPPAKIVEATDITPVDDPDHKVVPFRRRDH